MAYEQKDGDISIFANDKGDNAKRPDYRGDAKICGTKYRISLWLREPKNGGKKFLAGKIEADQKQPVAQSVGAVAAPATDTALDDLGF